MKCKTFIRKKLLVLRGASVSSRPCEMTNRHKDSRRANKREKRKTRSKFANSGGLSQSQVHHDQPGTLVQSVSGEEANRCQYLHYGAHIGNESRTLEFKRGEGNYLKDIFYSHVCIYGCAFLNCNGGTLLVGVYDSGVVRGVRIDQRMEDDVRLRVDDAVKTFQPTLFPCNYTLDFLPVIRPGKEACHLKVVRLTFTPPALVEPTLFHSGTGEVYMKRDGSVQGPLSVSHILEWSNQMWSSKVRQLERSVYEARCLLCFSCFYDRQRQMVALATEATGTNGMEDRLSSGQEAAGQVCRHPATPRPHRANRCINRTRRNSM